MFDSAAAGPMYERIKRELRTAIAGGEYEPGTPFITQREVCARYGVSTTTAVRALGDLVAEGMLVRRRGKGTYVVDQERRPKTASGADRTIACIVHGLQGPHVSRVVKGIESVCTEAGYRMFLTDTDASAEREERALRQALAAGTAGVVLYPVEGRANTEVLEEFRRERVPLVLVDRYRTDLVTDAVTFDNFEVGYRLTRELIERGHRRIATLWSETRCTSVRDRLTGHRRALREHDLPALPELTVLRSYWPQPDSARRSILSRLLAAPEPPTALLCANGYVLAAAVRDLLEWGIRIPEDIDLAGMDDAGPYDILPLTAVAAAVPSREMGATATRLLLGRAAADDPYSDVEHIVLPVEIRSRETSSGYLRAIAAPTRAR